jgi:hypothetical protein
MYPTSKKKAKPKNIMGHPTYRDDAAAKACEGVTLARRIDEGEFA